MNSASRFPSFWIALGGALGALCRYGVECAADRLLHSGAGFPWSTFGVNLAGAFLLGWILSRAATGESGSEWLRLFAGIGFCGAFTTFSSVNLEMVELAQSGSLALAAVYFVSSFVCGIAMAWVGAGFGLKPRKVS